MVKALRKPVAKSTYTRAGTLCPSRAPAATAPYCRRRGVFSRGGGKRGGRERGRGVKSRGREDGRFGQKVPPQQYDGGVAPGAIRNVQGASGRTWSRDRGGEEGNPPTPSVFPGRADFGGINGSSSSCSSYDSRISSDRSNSNDSGDLPALVGKPARDLEVFDELPVLQSGRMRSQSRGLNMSASYANALLAYAIRAVEAKNAIEEKAPKHERAAHDSLLEERLEKEREWLEEFEGRGALLD